MYRGIDCVPHPTPRVLLTSPLPHPTTFFPAPPTKHHRHHAVQFVPTAARRNLTPYTLPRYTQIMCVVLFEELAKFENHTKCGCDTYKESGGQRATPGSHRLCVKTRQETGERECYPTRPNYSPLGGEGSNADFGCSGDWSACYDDGPGVPLWDIAPSPPPLIASSDKCGCGKYMESNGEMAVTGAHRLCVKTRQETGERECYPTRPGYSPQDYDRGRQGDTGCPGDWAPCYDDSEAAARPLPPPLPPPLLQVGSEASGAGNVEGRVSLWSHPDPVSAAKVHAMTWSIDDTPEPQPPRPLLKDRSSLWSHPDPVSAAQMHAMTWSIDDTPDPQPSHLLPPRPPLPRPSSPPRPHPPPPPLSLWPLPPLLSSSRLVEAFEVRRTAVGNVAVAFDLLGSTHRGRLLWLLLRALCLVALLAFATAYLCRTCRRVKQVAMSVYGDDEKPADFADVVGYSKVHPCCMAAAMPNNRSIRGAGGGSARSNGGKAQALLAKGARSGPDYDEDESTVLLDDGSDTAYPLALVGHDNEMTVPLDDGSDTAYPLALVGHAVSRDAVSLAWHGDVARESFQSDGDDMLEMLSRIEMGRGTAYTDEVEDDIVDDASDWFGNGSTVVMDAAVYVVDNATVAIDDGNKDDRTVVMDEDVHPLALLMDTLPNGMAEGVPLPTMPRTVSAVASSYWQARRPVWSDALEGDEPRLLLLN